jgi:hypothetical protein
MSKTASTSIVITAPIESVWAAMTQTANYPNWNPFIYAAETSATGLRITSGSPQKSLRIQCGVDGEETAAHSKWTLKGQYSQK